MLQDQLAVACVVTIELKAGLADDQRLKKRLPLDEWKLGDVPICQVQEIESVIDDVNAALAARVWAKLGSPASSPTKLAIDVSGLYLEVRKRGDDARIFGRPVEPGPGQQLRMAIVDARGHTIAVELDLMQPLRPRRRLLDR